MPVSTRLDSSHACHLLSTVQPEEDCKTQLNILVPFLIQSKTQNSGKALQALSTPSPCQSVDAKSFSQALYHTGCPFLPRPSAIAFSSWNAFVPDVPGWLRTQLFHRKFLPDHAMQKSNPYLIRDSLSLTESWCEQMLIRCLNLFQAHL